MTRAVAAGPLSDWTETRFGDGDCAALEHFRKAAALDPKGILNPGKVI